MTRTLSAKSLRATLVTPDTPTADVVYRGPDQVAVTQGDPADQRMYIGNDSFARLPGQRWLVHHEAGAGRKAAFNDVFLPLRAALHPTSVTRDGADYRFVSPYSGHTDGRLQVQGEWVASAEATIDLRGTDRPVVVQATYTAFDTAPPITRPPGALSVDAP